ncbi:hypothetical protein HPB47_021386 [Ixodes persulcatus]|uniref:Uncharacterized protein n=1 Tax=Ixodes persulcatus TaxID=34615 RepID=A0AC60QCL9_IXOPE|nr:hypothetical protein HPB47_021386 [Ixodes persulcatus]
MTGEEETSSPAFALLKGKEVNRGWTFKEEGYVRNVRWNASDDSQICLVRAICLPSMKKAPYTVSAWFVSGTVRIMGGSCSCVAGLSETCHHISALLLTAEESCNASGTSCTDIPCIWAVPSQGVYIRDYFEIRLSNIKR